MNDATLQLKASLFLPMTPVAHRPSTLWRLQFEAYALEGTSSPQSSGESSLIPR